MVRSIVGIAMIIGSTRVILIVVSMRAVMSMMVTVSMMIIMPVGIFSVWVTMSTAVVWLVMSMGSIVIILLKSAFEQLFYFRLVDAGASLSRIKNEAIRAEFSALDKREAHAGVLIPELTLSTYWVLVKAHLLAIRVTPESFSRRNEFLFFLLFLLLLLFLFLFLFLFFFFFLFFLFDRNAGAILRVYCVNSSAYNFTVASTLIEVWYEEFIVAAVELAFDLVSREMALFGVLTIASNFLFLFLLVT